MKIQQKANREYRKERQMYLHMLHIAARFYFKTKNEEFKEHMRWISAHLQRIEEKRKSGAYVRWQERSDALDKHLAEIDAKLGRPKVIYTH